MFKINDIIEYKSWSNSLITGRIIEIKSFTNEILVSTYDGLGNENRFLIEESKIINNWTEKFRQY